MTDKKDDLSELGRESVPAKLTDEERIQYAAICALSQSVQIELLRKLREIDPEAKNVSAVVMALIDLAAVQCLTCGVPREIWIEWCERSWDACVPSAPEKCAALLAGSEPQCRN